MKPSLDLFTGANLRDIGIKAAIDHANSEQVGWEDQAFAILKAYIEHFGGSFMCDDVVTYAAKFELIAPPPDSRAWGQIIVRACKEGLIKKYGFAERKNPKHHRGVARVWIAV